MGNASGVPVSGSLLGTTDQINITAGTNTLTLSTPQSIGLGSSPTFNNVKLNGLTATRLTSTDASKNLQSVTISNANGCNSSFSGSTLTNSMTQDLATTASPSFVQPYLTGLGTGQLVMTAPFTKQVVGVMDRFQLVVRLMDTFLLEI